MRWRLICRCGRTRSRPREWPREWHTGGVSMARNPAENGCFGEPAANALAIKSLSYVLVSDLTGICEIPRYAWFSHREDGSPLEPYHRYAVVMPIDQGYDT